ncbi:MAG: ribbon-helix-helix protein, CopG family [Mycobacteriales bacterium]|jgi:hypothetical protein
MAKTANVARRVTVNLRASDVERIEKIAESTGLSANEVIRRALATESFIVENRNQDRKILIEDKDGTVQRVEFLY